MLTVSGIRGEIDVRGLSEGGRPVIRLSEAAVRVSAEALRELLQPAGVRITSLETGLVRFSAGVRLPLLGGATVTGQARAGHAGGKEIQLSLEGLRLGGLLPLPTSRVLEAIRRSGALPAGVELAEDGQVRIDLPLLLFPHRVVPGPVRRFSVTPRGLELDLGGEA